MIVAIGAHNAVVRRQGVEREHVQAVLPSVVLVCVLMCVLVHVLVCVLPCALSNALLINLGVAGLGARVQSSVARPC